MRGTHRQYDRPTREAVVERLNKWLDGPYRKGDGGFAAIVYGEKEEDPDDISELDDLILDLVKYRFEGDSDGDRALRWTLMDWHRYEVPNYQLIPQDSRNNPDRANIAKRRFEALVFNLGAASNAIERELRLRRHDEFYAREQDEKAADKLALILANLPGEVLEEAVESTPEVLDRGAFRRAFRARIERIRAKAAETSGT